MISPVVDLAWLKEHEGHVKLADVRWYLDGRSGREAFEKGHLPGAVFIELEKWLAGPGGAEVGRHPLPDPARFAEGMSAVGIGDGSTVLAYDDAGGVIAARLVWMLRVLGEDAALLDGGIQRYQGPLETGKAIPISATFSPRPWPPARLANIDDAQDNNYVVIDARNRERYRGDADPIDPRSGHIPGAVNIPCRENLNNDGTFLPVDVLRKRFTSAGVEEGADVISYCGSGVTACHNLLSMEYVGLGLDRLYPGSWSHYSQRVDLPVSTGD